ncbi:MAG: DUF349 domain-containing protein [Bacteroidales bacterium]|nr:DUF349 domain-containing protein [Bacteroidales bacterium]
MEPTNVNSVQNEQISRTDVLAEHMNEDIPSVIPTENVTNESNALFVVEEEVQYIDEHVILPEDVAVPEELADEEIDEETLSEAADYSQLSKEELVNLAEKLVKEGQIEAIRVDIENIKIHFYKKHKSEIERLRKQFLDEGGNPEDFKPQPDGLEEKLKEILKHYKEVKAEYTKKSEAEKAENLRIKREIIEQIKELTSTTESLHETFHQFRELQRKWRSVGPVPQHEVSNLWESYNYYVEKFYDYIKINKELRDLDLKKNLEAKIELCEQAEALLLEPSAVKAFRMLQEYHNKWREIGPVPVENRAEIWNRFKEITSKINKRHQEYYDNLKASQLKNLGAKTVLCEKIEAILQQLPQHMKEWEERTKEIIEIQKVWRTIGFAPRKDNNKIYERFRKACDEFFAQKRAYYNKIKEEQNNNLQLKLDLCVQAEALKDSTEWKKTTEDLINIQKRWKEIGPVPRKYSDQIWKRFRAACDTFFNNKAAYFAQIDSKYDENLKAKLALIEEIENYQFDSDTEVNFNKLKEFQRRWSEIGFVPLKNKQEVQQRYKKAIDRIFEGLRVDDGKRRIEKFKSKIEQVAQKKSETQLNRERDRLISQLKKLESDIVVWENNIGFFAKTKNAESMIRDVQQKIDNAKEEIKVLEQKIRIIENMVND